MCACLRFEIIAVSQLDVDVWRSVGTLLPTVHLCLHEFLTDKTKLPEAETVCTGPDTRRP